ncbi:MAG: hypothetical protein A2161_16165 [Candidatus Schekmanbacteria bacterium RBG_13_48_7]|uniref:PIN domain-containing protein n=1 Tax=Candidatus Schekmanbacteria bacterium RBG_13_48_7 TaxID=1817878 RepID=A0A1F7RTI9_9BACT|nr:MAG: hypothetical protein A2161_16165 [Candidatus Schekmanbacteria bacterium RBG_13_48_7]
MSVHVLDASAFGALIFNEPLSENVARALSAGNIIAPYLLMFEISSICLKKIKAHPENKEQILRAFNLVPRFAIKYTIVDHISVIKLALETGLTIYDTSYLWLAINVQGNLVTLDKKLQKVYSHLTK